MLKPKQHQPWTNTNRLTTKIHSSIYFSTTAFRTPSPRIAEILMNAAMLLEREKHIGAAPYQRGAERNGETMGKQVVEVLAP